MNESIRSAVQMLGDEIHQQNGKWWRDLDTGAPIQRNVGEVLCLIHSEVSEALEGHRKSLMDDELPHRPMLEVELADVLIRVIDAGMGFGLDVAGAVAEKLEYNARRADHTVEARRLAHGKKY